VHVDPVSGRPARLGADFARLYGEAAGGRRVDARLHHEPQPPGDLPSRPWAWRVADFDVLGHVNNAAYGAAVEELLHDERDVSGGLDVELEYREPALPGSVGALVAHREGGRLDAWIFADAAVACTVRLAHGESGAAR
jgi:acyl-ACP thioesterase